MLSLRYPRLWLSLAWLCVGAALAVCLAPSRTAALSPLFEINDKLTHALGFCGLMICFAGIYPRSRDGWIGLGLLSMGILVELLQGWMSLGRNAEFIDVIADAAGIGAGMLLARVGLGSWAQRLESLWSPT